MKSSNIESLLEENNSLLKKLIEVVRLSSSLAYNIDDFCSLVGGISRTTYWKLRKQNLSPQIKIIRPNPNTKGRQVISAEAAKAWIKNLEDHKGE